jgi:hypothetical protein
MTDILRLTLIILLLTITLAAYFLVIGAFSPTASPRLKPSSTSDLAAPSVWAWSTSSSSA